MKQGQRVLVTSGQHAGKIAYFHAYAKGLSEGLAILSKQPTGLGWMEMLVVKNHEITDFEILEGWFNWNRREDFLIEIPEVGCFIWSSPSYGGNGSIRKFEGEHKDWERSVSRGRHKVGEYVDRH